MTNIKNTLYNKLRREIMIKFTKDTDNIRYYLQCGFTLARANDFKNTLESAQCTQEIRELLQLAYKKEFESLSALLSSKINIDGLEKSEDKLNFLLNSFASSEEARDLILIGYIYWRVLSAVLISQHDPNFKNADLVNENTDWARKILSHIPNRIIDDIDSLIAIMVEATDFNTFVETLIENINKMKEINDTNYDVFISYRRSTGEDLAARICEHLRKRGFNPFIDFESLRSGKFNEQLYQYIDNAPNFVLILSKNALDRCINEDDWVRLEIERALSGNKNIVPVCTKDFVMNTEKLPESLSELPLYQQITPSSALFEASMDLLAKNLNKR